MAPPSDPKAVLIRYLTVAHDAVLWKLDGLSDYDVRRPLTPTGSNMLGLVKHLAWVELGYFGDAFERPHGIDLAEYDEENPNADMYATADESRHDVLALFETARAHAISTIEDLELDAQGHVPWWGENNPVTLRLIVVHMTTEMYRHLGHIDIMREGIDGSVGLRDGNLNTAAGDDAGWPEHYRQLTDIAEQFRDT